MASTVVVTSWSPEGYRTYGKRFIETFLRCWPESIPLHVWHEAEPPEESDARLHAFDLSLDEDLQVFVREHSSPKTLSKDPLWGAIKWCKKVFAISQPRYASAEAAASATWMIWIDGDVEHTGPVTTEFLHAVCADDADLAFLGRPWYRYSECGFVAYRIEALRVRELLIHMRKTYASGDVFQLPEWGDSFVFDRCRKALGGLRENDLARHLCPPDRAIHIWPATILGTVMRHNKGPGRKTQAYGATT